MNPNQENVVAKDMLRIIKKCDRGCILADDAESVREQMPAGPSLSSEICAVRGR